MNLCCLLLWSLALSCSSLRALAIWECSELVGQTTLLSHRTLVFCKQPCPLQVVEDRTHLKLANASAFNVFIRADSRLFLPSHPCQSFVFLPGPTNGLRQCHGLHKLPPTHLPWGTPVGSPKDAALRSPVLKGGRKTLSILVIINVDKNDDVGLQPSPRSPPFSACPDQGDPYP